MIHTLHCLKLKNIAKRTNKFIYHSWTRENDCFLGSIDNRLGRIYIEEFKQFTSSHKILIKCKFKAINGTGA